MKQFLFHSITLSALLVPMLCATAGAEETPVEAAPDLSSQSIVQLTERLRLWREARTAQTSALPVRNQSSTRAQSTLYQPAQRALGVVLQGAAAVDNRPQSAFPSTWRWSSERRDHSRALFNPNETAAEAWNLGFDAPIEHPFGTAKLIAKYEEQGGGVANSAEAATQENERRGNIALVQDLQIGNVSGSTKIALSQNSTAQPFSSAPEQEKGTAEGSANLKWQVLPSLAVVGSHQSRVEQQREWTGEDATDPTGNTQHKSTVGIEWRWRKNISPSLAFNSSHRTNFNWRRWQTREGSQFNDPQAEQRLQNLSDASLQWQWSKALSMSVGANRTHIDVNSLQRGERVPASLRDELKATLSLQHRTSAGSWGLNYARLHADQTISNPEDRRNDQVSLEAERRLMSWLSLRGVWRLTGEDNYINSQLHEQAQREAEAQIQLSSLGRFALRYADWERRQSTLGGEAASDSAAREYGIRYNIGADRGLGLSMEYNIRDERVGENSNNWRLGVTYR